MGVEGAHPVRRAGAGRERSRGVEDLEAAGAGDGGEALIDRSEAPEGPRLVELGQQDHGSRDAVRAELLTQLAERRLLPLPSRPAVLIEPGVVPAVVAQ